jgi:HAD superfamily hydrolase (TIGR01549 family)
MDLCKYDTIILDCDGVIFDSNYLKIDAFQDALKEYETDSVKSFLEYFKNNFGTSRYSLAKVFIENFLNINFDENMYQEILSNYSKNCIILYQKAATTKSFFQFIEKYQDKNLYIASGSDQEELKEVFEQRGMSQYFIEVFGSPKKKNDIVKNIVFNHPNAVMIGDAISDMKAAKENNIDFIFMKEYSTNEKMKQDSSLTSIQNLGDLI